MQSQLPLPVEVFGKKLRLLPPDEPPLVNYPWIEYSAAIAQRVSSPTRWQTRTTCTLDVDIFLDVVARFRPNLLAVISFDIVALRHIVSIGESSAPLPAVADVAASLVSGDIGCARLNSGEISAKIALISPTCMS